MMLEHTINNLGIDPLKNPSDKIEKNLDRDYPFTYIPIPQKSNIYDYLKEVAKKIKHVVLFPDGNRRWARLKGLPESDGHKRAFTQLSSCLIKDLIELNVHTMTLWGTSPYTWRRSKYEVDNLMNYFCVFLKVFLPIAHQYEVKINHLGKKDLLPQSILEALDYAQKETNKYAKHILNFAIDYGGNDDVLRACKKIISQKIKAEDLTEEIFSQFLDTANQSYPCPDLIIRGSGEYRISGFMVWQTPFSEWRFEKELYPDFNGLTLQNAILDFAIRERRFSK